MKILIVEDDLYKSKAIENFIIEEFGFNEITCKESLSSGIFEVLDNPDYSLILLDMSMPSFDVSEKDPSGGVPESYAGEDFLAQLSLLEIKIPVIVVTQFDNFGGGDSSLSLTSLNQKLLSKHPDIYQGSVYFKSTSNEWKLNLKYRINKVME
ncbi:TPA: response regulator [Yersinia enterocolitica]|nr:hypothetical protein [Yersinia enterocolitica]HDL6660563.1 hypothetical protein [Yersinia enterocolitica]HDL6664051.1 hypothetical protein [Yersinia enterocolitica]HDL6712389.1 hypothetical protein [Yersinia enterocolitica]HDL6754646.1 hypothetical protein [Yersinia enterocolitica]